MNPLCLAAWVLVLALIPFLVIYRITETEQQKTIRLRKSGWTQKAIASRLGITTYKVRKNLTTA